VKHDNEKLKYFPKLWYIRHNWSYLCSSSAHITSVLLNHCLTELYASKLKEYLHNHFWEREPHLFLMTSTTFSVSASSSHPLWEPTQPSDLDLAVTELVAYSRGDLWPLNAKLIVASIKIIVITLIKTCLKNVTFFWTVIWSLTLMYGAK